MRHEYRLVAIFSLLTLLALASTSLARPVHQDRRAQADAEQSLLWPFGKPTPAVQHQPNVRPQALHRRHEQPQRPLRLHELLQQNMGPPQQAQPARPTVRQRATGPVRRHLARKQVARAHYAAPVVDDAATSKGGPRAAALVAEARRYLGTNPTRRARLWCARFVNFVLDRVGLPGTDSDAAKSFAYYGRRVSKPQYGAIAVLTRKGGGHVGIVTGVDRRGNPILIAGNNGRRKVGISVYPKRRVIAYVVPDGTAPSKSRIREARR
jgi:uncharacterized protein (TIGR02594 family)